jgi:hypothetical protein
MKGKGGVDNIKERFTILGSNNCLLNTVIPPPLSDICLRSRNMLMKNTHMTFLIYPFTSPPFLTKFTLEYSVLQEPP